MKQEKLKNIHFDFQCGIQFSELKKMDGKPFCYKCSTVVHDLRNATYEEVTTLFKENNSMCATFYNDQFEEPFNIIKNRSAKRMVLSSLLGALTFIAIPKNSSATPKYTTVQTDSPTDTLKKTPPTVIKTENTDEPVSCEKPKHRNGRLQLFRIGYRNVYLSKRFPFLHIRRQIMGKFRY